MLADTTAPDVITATATLITAATAFVAAVGGLWLAQRKLRDVEHKVDSAAAVARDTNQQVTTMNGKSIAQLGDAAETRRIQDLAQVDRTAQDVQHLSDIPNADSPPAPTVPAET